MKPALKILAVVVIAGGIVYWMRFSPVEVQAFKAERGQLVSEVMGTGTLEAKVRASVSPKITGLLTQVLVDQDDRVVKGQLLAKLDDGDLRQQVEIARAELAAAKASVDLTVASIASAQATAAQAKSNFARLSTLQRSGATSQADLEKAQESAAVAESNLIRAGLAKIEAERLVAKAEVSLLYYQARLADTSVCAPFDGLVARRNHEPGDVVVPGGSIVDIVSTAQLWISAWVDETAIGSLSVGQPAKVVFRSAPASSLSGRVMRLAPETDRETREFLVDVGLESLPEKWAVGQRAEVYIETGRRNDVVCIPQRLVVWRGGQAGVLIDDGGKARWRKISLGLHGRENVEIIDGLTAGQIVIGVPQGASPPRDGRAIKYGKP